MTLTVDLSGYGEQDALEYAAVRRRFEQQVRLRDDSAALDALRYIVLILGDVRVGELNQNNVALGRTATELLDLVRRRSEPGKMFPQCRTLLWQIVIDCWLTADAGGGEEKRLAGYLVGMPITSIKSGDVEQLLRDRITAHYPGDRNAEYLAEKSLAFLDEMASLPREMYHSIAVCVANRAVSRISAQLLYGIGSLLGPLHGCHDGTAVGLVLEYLPDLLPHLVKTAEVARVPVPAFYELGVEWQHGVPDVTLSGAGEVTYRWSISFADGTDFSTIASGEITAARRAREILTQWKLRRIEHEIAPLGITINLEVYWEKHLYPKSPVTIDV